MKIAIWVIGAMASGKTTQNRNLIQFFADHDSMLMEGEIGGVNYCFTHFGFCSSIGIMKDGVDTCGIDPVMGKIGVKGVDLSIREAKKISDIVIIEGAQAALTWADFIESAGFDRVFLFHLKLSYEQNFKRLKSRQIAKLRRKGTDVDEVVYELSDKNYESVLGKNKQYNNLWEKINHRFISVQIDATNDAATITEQIKQAIWSRL